MIDNKGPYATKFPQNQSWSIDYFTTDDWKSKRIIRKFINSAIYVEKPMLGMPPLRKKSPIFLNSGSDGEYTCRTCSSDANETTRMVRGSSISLNSFTPQPEEIVNTKKYSPKSSGSCSTNSSSDAESQITVKSIKPDVHSMGSEIKLSLTPLSTDRNSHINVKEKQAVIKQWLEKKDEERKKRKMEEARIKEAKEKERQLLLEKERENFKKWLTEKKQAEERNRKLKELEEEKKKLKEVEKEKRRAENELCFNKWLRRKKKMDLERKIKDKLALIQLYEQKQKRIEDNEKAFEEWLRNSKNKPKPIPLNQGLQSLCSSTSVTYINPVPWNPNIELPQKPVSH
ncbi:histone-lysine N-methyltransferase, H3 lysine-79 specific-like [Anoplophora glabripennis]|uniref:histone-lysine N-methyltransferase, H3 lysine-79 specific-like n=1 Tax=Anoplophora glabripennis TaxID=217634 RepID=UPI000A13F07B|nr:histone-lysine N-methyltransferase, H3 lysine-79 specific-like [Anoplophora glabripennis]